MKVKFFKDKQVIQVSAGNQHTLALTKDNELYGWGQGVHGECGFGAFENSSIPRIAQIPFVNIQNNNEVRLSKRIIEFLAV